MFIEIQENNLTAWADYAFCDTATQIDETYSHIFDNGYHIENGVVYPPEAHYTEKRAAEYPRYTEYLDAIVKCASTDEAIRGEGESQRVAYIDACLAVKAKYPK